MSRRSSDKSADRLTKWLLVLAFAASALAAFVSFKAIRALDKFDAFIEAASEIRKAKSLIPEGY